MIEKESRLFNSHEIHLDQCSFVSAYSPFEYNFDGLSHRYMIKCCAIIITIFCKYYSGNSVSWYLYTITGVPNPGATGPLVAL